VEVDDVDADLALVEDRLVVRKVNSIGSSIVTMCIRSRSLMYWSIEAIVVLLPDPVTPARMMIPCSYCVNSAMTGGRPRPSKLGIELLTRRATRLRRPRARNRLTRKRVSRSPSKRMCAKSTPPSSSRIFFRRGRDEREHQPLHVGHRQRRELHRPQDPRKAHHGGIADLQVKVGPLVLDRHPEQLVGLGLANLDNGLVRLLGHGRHGRTLLRVSSPTGKDSDSPSPLSSIDARVLRT
jgi:hypothetical protein